MLVFLFLLSAFIMSAAAAFIYCYRPEESPRSKQAYDFWVGDTWVRKRMKIIGFLGVVQFPVWSWTYQLIGLHSIWVILLAGSLCFREFNRLIFLVPILNISLFSTTILALLLLTFHIP